MADAELKIKNADGSKISLMFKLVLGGLTLGAIVVLAFMFRVEVGIVVLVLGLAGSARVVLGVIHQHKLSKYESRRLNAEVETLEYQALKAKYEADRAQLSVYFIDTSSGVFNLLELMHDNLVPKFYPSTGASKQLAYDNQLLLPAPTIEPIDLLSAFTQSQQCYAIIGGQQTGKTFQARHIASYWLSRGIQPWIVAPKWDKGEWDGCRMYGGLSDFEAVRDGINTVRSEANRRHADSTMRHREHALLPIFFDDWTVLVEPIEEASNLILEATTLYASVNIILYFIIHSDTSDAWGVKSKGAALKNNFVKLFIEPDYNTSGQVVRQNLKGFILFPGEVDRRPAKLFSGMPVMPMALPARIEPVVIENDIPDSEVYSDMPPMFKPNADELRIYELHLQGYSLNAIWKEVHPDRSYGGIQAGELKEVLRRFNVSL